MTRSTFFILAARPPAIGARRGGRRRASGELLGPAVEKWLLRQIG